MPGYRARDDIRTRWLKCLFSFGVRCDIQSRKSSEDALGHVLKLWMEILSAVFIQKKATGSAASIPKAAAIDLDSSLLERKLTENSESLLKFLDDALEEAAEMSAMGKPPTRLGRLRVQIVEVFVTAFKICGKVGTQHRKTPSIHTHTNAQMLPPPLSNLRSIHVILCSLHFLPSSEQNCPSLYDVMAMLKLLGSNTTSASLP